MASLQWCRKNKADPYWGVIYVIRPQTSQPSEIAVLGRSGSVCSAKGWMLATSAPSMA
jgi:hypothetical protein